jgi:predicted transcriptional regulator
MAGVKKEKIDSFLFPCDFFHDRKTKQLKRRFGLKGIAVYLFIRAEIGNDHGYYTELNEDLVFDISDALDISETLVQQIIEYLLNRSLLVGTSILVKSVTTIYVTSAESQYCFQKAKCQTGAKRDVIVDGRIWVLSKEDTLNFIKVECPNNTSDDLSDVSTEESAREEKLSRSKTEENLSCIESEYSTVHRQENNGISTHTFSLSEQDKNELIKDFGELLVEEYISKVDMYCQSTGKKYANYSATIKKWLTEDLRKGLISKDTQSVNTGRESETSYSLSDWNNLAYSFDLSMLK